MTAPPSSTWISHRGLKTHATENTRVSFQNALKAGFRTFETDLRVTCDAHIVLCHDTNFGKFCSDKRPIHQLKRREIEKIRFHNGDSPYFFDEFINDFAGYSWVFDIKPEKGSETISALKTWTQNHRAAEWIMHQSKFLTWKEQHENEVLSFLKNAKFYARERECWTKGLCCLFGLGIIASLRKNRTYAIPPKLMGVPILTPQLVSKYHKKGAFVVAYLPRDLEEENIALASQADEILTDGLPNLTTSSR